MRYLLCAAVAVAALFTTTSEAPASPFVNLGFNDALPPDDLLPGWTTGGTELRVNYGDVCLGSACIILRGGGPEGEYGLYLQSGYAGELGLTGVSISQAGDVPADAKSIRMLSDASVIHLGWENLRASLDGQDIPLQMISVIDEVVTIGGNLPSGFAGANAVLKIETVAIDDGIERWSRLDGIAFSPLLVPEPMTTTGLVLSIAMLGARRPRHRQASTLFTMRRSP